MRDYGKVFSRIWESADFRALSEDGRTLVLYLLTCQHGTIAGAFRVPDGYACEDLQWGQERVLKGFEELLSKGFANRCGTTKWVWIFKFLEWNAPENPNQRKAAAKVAASVPDACAWKPEFMRACGPLLGIEATQEEKPFSNPSETVLEPVTVAVAGIPEKAKASSSSAEPTGQPAAKTSGKPSAPTPYREIVGLYHEALPMLPKVKVFDGRLWEARCRAMRETWAWVLSSKREDGTRRAETADEAIEWLRGYFAQAAENDFVAGRARPGAGHENWRADIDYLLSPKGIRMVLERTQETA